MTALDLSTISHIDGETGSIGTDPAVALHCLVCLKLPSAALYVVELTFAGVVQNGSRAGNDTF